MESLRKLTHLLTLLWPPSHHPQSHLIRWLLKSIFADWTLRIKSLKSVLVFWILQFLSRTVCVEFCSRGGVNICMNARTPNLSRKSFYCCFSALTLWLTDASCLCCTYFRAFVAASPDHQPVLQLLYMKYLIKVITLARGSLPARILLPNLHLNRKTLTKIFSCGWLFSVGVIFYDLLLSGCFFLCV